MHFNRHLRAPCLTVAYCGPPGAGIRTIFERLAGELGTECVVGSAVEDVSRVYVDFCTDTFGRVAGLTPQFQLVGFDTWNVSAGCSLPGLINLDAVVFVVGQATPESYLGLAWEDLCDALAARGFAVEHFPVLVQRAARGEVRRSDRPGDSLPPTLTHKPTVTGHDNTAVSLNVLHAVLRAAVGSVSKPVPRRRRDGNSQAAAPSSP